MKTALRGCDSPDASSSSRGPGAPSNYSHSQRSRGGKKAQPRSPCAGTPCPRSQVSVRTRQQLAMGPQGHAAPHPAPERAAPARARARRVGTASLQSTLPTPAPSPPGVPREEQQGGPHCTCSWDLRSSGRCVCGQPRHPHRHGAHSPLLRGAQVFNFIGHFRYLILQPLQNTQPVTASSRRVPRAQSSEEPTKATCSQPAPPWPAGDAAPLSPAARRPSTQRPPLPRTEAGPPGSTRPPRSQGKAAPPPAPRTGPPPRLCFPLLAQVSGPAGGSPRGKAPPASAGKRASERGQRPRH